jgi:hypothetical protein
MRPLADDTPADVEQRQIEGWRQMTSAQKLSLVMELSDTVRQLALAGVQQRHPHASPRDQFLRLAIVTLGRELALQVYPEIGALDDA